MKIMKLTKILNEIYPQAGGQGERILHKDLMPHIKGMPGTEDIQDWLEQNGDIPEYMIPRLAKDPRTLKFLKSLLPQIKQAAQQRRMNPQNQSQSTSFNPPQKVEEYKDISRDEIKEKIRNILSKTPGKNKKEIRTLLPQISPQEIQYALDEMEGYFQLERDQKGGYHLPDTFNSF